MAPNPLLPLLHEGGYSYRSYSKLRFCQEPDQSYNRETVVKVVMIDLQGGGN